MGGTSLRYEGRVDVPIAGPIHAPSGHRVRLFDFEDVRITSALRLRRHAHREQHRRRGGFHQSIVRYTDYGAGPRGNLKSIPSSAPSIATYLTLRFRNCKHGLVIYGNPRSVHGKRVGFGTGQFPRRDRETLQYGTQKARDQRTEAGRQMAGSVAHPGPQGKPQNGLSQTRHANARQACVVSSDPRSLRIASEFRCD